MKIKLYNKFGVSFIVGALFGVLFFGQAVFADERFSTSLVKTINGAFLWQLVNVGGTIYSGSYNYADTNNQVFYYATDPSSAGSWSAYPVGNTLNHESTRVYNLNGNFYVTSEGIPKTSNPPVTGGAQIYANWAKIDDFDYQYSLLATYFDDKYLIGWSPRTADTSKLSTSDGTKLYEAPPGSGSKNFFLDVPEVMAFSAEVYKDALYLHGCDTYSYYKADDSGLLVRVDKDKTRTIINKLKHTGSAGALNVFDDKLFIATGKTVNLISYNGDKYKTEKTFSAEWEVGEMEIFRDKLFVTVASQVNGDYKAEIWYRTKDSEGGVWSLAVSNSTFRSLGTAPGGAGNLVNGSGWLAAGSDALYVTFVKGSSQRNGMEGGSNDSYIYRVTEIAQTEPTCTLNFTPTEIDARGKSAFSWTVTGEISNAWLSCDLVGSAEVGEILKTYPSGTVDWTVDSGETEICKLYLNSTSATGTPSCTTDPGLRAKSDNACQLNTCVGNSCWNGTTYATGTKTEDCATGTASATPSSLSEPGSSFVTWSSQNASAVDVACEGIIPVPRGGFLYRSAEECYVAGTCELKGTEKGLNLTFGESFFQAIEKHETCIFYPTNQTDSKPGTPFSFTINFNEEVTNAARYICQPDNSGCAQSTCKDVHCFDGCKNIQGTKDCRGRE